MWGKHDKLRTFLRVAVLREDSVAIEIWELLSIGAIFRGPSENHTKERVFALLFLLPEHFFPHFFPTFFFFNTIYE